MAEEYVFRRRNRLRKHFVITSNVLLYGYEDLSDGAKITYQVIDSFDWEDGKTGTSKGYSFPSLKTIARARGKSWTTIWRHIEELIKADLITKQSRAKEGKPSILIIEDISEEEEQKYLAEFADAKHDKRGVLQKCNGGVLQDCKPKEDEDNKENENNVIKREPVDNADVPDSLRAILKRLPRSRASNKNRFLDQAKKDYLAQKMAEELKDMESIRCYRVIAEQCPPELIFEVLSIVKDTANQGKVRQSRAALFVDLVKRYCQKRGIELHFKSRETPKEKPSATEEAFEASQ